MESELTELTVFQLHDSNFYPSKLEPRAPERIDFKLAVLVYSCLHGTAPSYLVDELHHVTDLEAQRRLRSGSFPSLIVRHTRLSTIGDRSFPVIAAHV